MEFDIGDLVWVVLTKGQYSPGEHSKHAVTKIGPVPILKNINPNAYGVHLPNHFHSWDVFNVCHSIPYFTPDNTTENSKPNFFQLGENYEVDK